MQIDWKKRLPQFIRGWAGSIIIAVLIATSIKSAIADWNLVPTGSMKPTIVEGDRIFVNKLAYDLKVPYTTWRIAEWDSPKRGDIVVFFSPEDGKRLVKRVVGLPGDAIALMENRLLINGEETEYEPRSKEPSERTDTRERLRQHLLMENLDGRRHSVLLTPARPSHRFYGPVTVPEGSYFMLGDNRDNSADSRAFGFVERKQIVGEATSIVASLDLENRHRPRWERFFTKLH